MPTAAQCQLPSSSQRIVRPRFKPILLAFLKSIEQSEETVDWTTILAKACFCAPGAAVRGQMQDCEASRSLVKDPREKMSRLPSATNTAFNVTVVM